MKRRRIAELAAYVGALALEEYYEPLEGHWMFRGGGSCCRCTDGALKVADAFAGRVVGYDSCRNRDAFIGAPNQAGHDFALIDERFIVDYWAFRVAKLIRSPVLDLSVAEERKLAKHLYGDRRLWDDVSTGKQSRPAAIGQAKPATCGQNSRRLRR